ncbi:NAD(+) synthase [Methermicoccus shengliensis]|uniref:NH(3)-dependent NAD(+) synthetase n=1 Tax=Methermicoccus shengliensis TaxID=660064 RepID=A0A832RZI1_9EURY|nr:NAD(+) synthase [Methermicoccus shengliensis]KUK04440.1 MAG: NH(3)-dependent NAD(+) synthetase [Euryarchaeota archaeon 55_53]KUK30553.1 MAG: NH(3)-dependent NAD(+) synthetase [Methanosarcinales archeaon 56_1174]MDI3488081.1 synthase [Methanosarcinales archaeon]MDN5295720.1 synthase [Methanosarcinales archaeon]HIH70146.1 NAD(+) synthase [Methermicoccus shengliensis]
MDMEQFVERCTAWISQKVEQAHAEGVVVGMSGGVDSSVCAVLCKRAVGDRVLGLIMPLYSSQSDIEDALTISHKFGIATKTVRLEEPYMAMLDAMGARYSERSVECANLKARLRMCTLYYYANSLNLLVAGTSNKSELLMGYFTKYGDGAADILPIASLLKREVRELAAHLGIPEHIIHKPPSAGLWPGQTDEAELGITYEVIDAFIGGEHVSERHAACIREIMQKNAHKRELPPVFVP